MHFIFIVDFYNVGVLVNFTTQHTRIYGLLTCFLVTFCKLNLFGDNGVACKS